MLYTFHSIPSPSLVKKKKLLFSTYVRWSSAGGNFERFEPPGLIPLSLDGISVLTNPCYLPSVICVVYNQRRSAGSEDSGRECVKCGVNVLIVSNNLCMFY
jgi:hypothetical protein